jgi:hypothetical protein
METNDIDLDDIGALFMKNSSPNVTLGKFYVYILGSGPENLKTSRQTKHMK